MQSKETDSKVHIRGLIHHPDESRLLLIVFLSILAGIIGSLFAISLYYLVSYIQVFFFEILLPFFTIQIGNYNLGYVFLPVLGASLVSPILTKWAPHLKGGGVGTVLEDVSFKRVEIKPYDFPLKLIASALTMGSGGSGGPEGPIIQMSGSIGSMVGNWFHLSPNEKRILITCAIAAGIAAVFNSPVGGAVFAIELFVPSFEFFITLPVFLAAIVGGYIGQFLLTPELHLSDIIFTSNLSGLEMGIICVLGILCGLMGYFWVRFFMWAQKTFRKLPISPLYLPIIGALITGIILMFFPDMGINRGGLHAINQAIHLSYGWALLLGLSFLKMISTSASIGSGGSGGLFAPSLYIGCFFGGAIGEIFSILFPNVISNPSLYYILGMGAVFAAASQEPIGILLIIIEMAANLELAIPLALVILIAFAVAWYFSKGLMIYTTDQELRHVPIHTDTITTMMNSPVGEFIIPNIIPLTINMSIEDAAEILKDNSFLILPVLDGEKIVGVVYPTEITPNNPQNIQTIVHPEYRAVASFTKILDCFDTMVANNLEWLLVVHPDDSTSYIGLFEKQRFLEHQTTPYLTDTNP